jgi:hypothetical protein
MRHSRAFRILLLLCASIPVRSNGYAADEPQPPEEASAIVKGEADVPLSIGGVGGVYFLASPGQLVVEVEKRDRHIRGRHTELRAILVGPDREVLQEVSIPFDGGARGSGTGAPQRARLSAQVERKGVYGLNITVSQDRYGDDIIWGFRTNCPHYLIETSRGHRDERRQEPIVLLNAGEPADVCFMPRQDAFGLEIANLPDGAQPCEVYDGRGTLIDTLQADAEGRASHTFPADVSRAAVPWRLHVPTQPATVQIDGVTRWENDDLFVNLPYWTPDPESWFPFQEYRWLLTPYSRTVCGQPGERGQIAFHVHNNSDRETAVRLRIECPDGKWRARLSTNRVTAGPKKTADVSVSYVVPPDGETRVCHVRATPSADRGFSTYSTLTVKGGTAPATQLLDMPVVLKPYQHENEQFGYLPTYPVESQPYFGLQNRPFISVGNGVATCRDGQWTTSDLSTAVRSCTPPSEASSFRMVSTKVAFDRDDDLYALAVAGSDAALLHSTDGGETFAAYLIPPHEAGRGGFDIEQFSGHNVPEGPPPLLRYTRTARDPKLRWRSLNDLELFLPEKVDGRLSVGDPIPISDKCIGLSAHSGIPASVVSRGAKVHVAWGEATDPEADVPGVPAYVATYDRETGRLGDPALIGYGAPPNDVHNSPSITMDSQGYLHVLAGTHGRAFPYARSLKPNDAHSGWTEAKPVGEGLPQTYIGLVCGPDDTLHLACRLWRNGVEPFPLSGHATLAYQRKRPGEPWEEPRVLIVAPFSEYSIFYHRLTIDRMGRLFLSYDYWSTYWFYRTDHFGSRRALLMSPDGGDTWKLVDNSDFG